MICKARCSWHSHVFKQVLPLWICPAAGEKATFYCLALACALILNPTLRPSMRRLVKNISPTWWTVPHSLCPPCFHSHSFMGLPWTRCMLGPVGGAAFSAAHSLCVEGFRLVHDADRSHLDETFKWLVIFLDMPPVVLCQYVHFTLSGSSSITSNWAMERLIYLSCTPQAVQ